MSSTHHEREEGSRLDLDFTKLQKIAATGHHVVPVVVQESTSGEVLIVAYANELALAHTRQTGLATFWSTSRNELWIKGKTSGDTLAVEEIRVNCEQNSLLYRVRLNGPGSCHTKDATTGQSRLGCYYRRVTADGALEFVA